MEIICTRPSCTRPRNFFSDLDDEAKLRTVQQRYCTTCGMPLFLADRYIPLRLLGKGGFGAAFLACDRYTPAMGPCVVKQFQPSGNLAPEELAIAQSLFQREAVVLEKLGNKHPQIPDLYAFFTPIFPSSDRKTEEQYFYLAQEFIDGQDLSAKLKTKGKYSEEEIKEILEEILKILDFVHQNHSIHRDIKPSNIMRHKNGLLYLLDFGAVKEITKGKGNQRRSTGIYSMGFAPPEQVSGGQVYPATDLYALAATCVNLLTGKPPESLYDGFNHRWNWRSDAPQISDRLSQILDKMLLSTPSQRFQSAEEVLQALNPTSTPSIAKQNINLPETSILQQNPHLSVASTPQQNPTSAPIQPQAPGKLSRKVRPRRDFSLSELLGNAAFIGFEGSLLGIGLISSLSFSGLSMGILGVVMGGLIFAQTRRIIEKIDLGIIAGITTGIIFFFPLLQGSLGMQSILVIATMSAAGAIAITALFRLIYKLLTRIV